MLQTEKKYIRQEHILLRLNELIYATRKQLQVICDLGGDRNASRVLRTMELDKMIQSVHRGCKVYSLTHSGKDQIGTSQRLKSGSIEHTLMRNELYIKLGMPKDWKNEQPINYGEDRLICDAFFSKGDQFHFVEVDHRATLRSNYEKSDKYAAISKAIFHQYQQHPTIIFYTLTHSRKEKLEGYMRKVGVKGVVMV